VFLLGQERDLYLEQKAEAREMSSGLPMDTGQALEEGNGLILTFLASSV
jgi:hypothetical protein